jgi:hypothetical protein
LLQVQATSRGAKKYYCVSSRKQTGLALAGAPAETAKRARPFMFGGKRAGKRKNCFKSTPYPHFSGVASVGQAKIFALLLLLSTTIFSKFSKK